MTRRSLLVLVTSLGLALAGAACGGDDATEPGATEAPTRATLMLNWTPNAHHLGVYVADRLGFYADAGIDLEIVEPATVGADAAVGTGDATFGISQAESLLPARAEGVPVVSIATIMPVNDSALMSLPEDGIREPGDLAGKTYGGFGGALETELIARLVACGGGDPASVRYVEVGNVDYVPGLDANRFDFVWIFSGWDALRATEVLDRDVNLLRFADHLDCIPNWYTPIFIANEETIERRPELVRSFLAATARGYRVAIEDPQRAAEVMLDAVPEMDEALLRAAADYHASRFAPDAPFGTQDRATWDVFAGFLVDAGLLARAPEPEAVFTNAFLGG
jgi:ABC-type nitrate/sulfonate/bicarbonate transport system substrate-binding protein